ncbi:MAG TPA: type II secretion system F family protein, partial [Fimbriimonadaceae bacterium]|nr:type II secretion system F family protein [Fimbriimonadaceae bacterium]
GAGIADTLRGTNAFSPIVMDMVDTGERTGNLDSMLLRMSTFYEDDSETRARQVAQIVSVILLLLVAVYVCVILVMAYTKLIGTEMSGGGD